MTVKELYEFAIERGIEDYTLRAQFRDDGGFYYGDEDILPVLEETGFVDDKRKVIRI